MVGAQHHLPAITLVLLSTLLLPAAAQPPQPQTETDGFGRWESPLQRCELIWPNQGQQPPQRSPCLKLRVDQTIEGMLRVRFINGPTNSRYASEELTFAGLLLKQDLPMRCHGGSCQPSWPLRLQVHGVATRRFDPRGIAAQLPHNQLARGSCQLEPQLLQCQAQDQTGQRWQATGQLQEQTNR